MSDTISSRRRSSSTSRSDGKSVSASSQNAPQTFSIFTLDRDRTPVLSVVENNVNFVVRRHEDNPSAFKLPIKVTAARDAELPADQYYPHDKAAILAERQRIHSLLHNPDNLHAQKRSLVFVPLSHGMEDDDSSRTGSCSDPHASASSTDSMEVSAETAAVTVTQDGAAASPLDNAVDTLDTLSSDPSFSSQSSQESSQPLPVPVAPRILSLDHIHIPLPAPGLELYRPSASQTSLLLAPNEYHNIKANRVANGGPARARTRTRDEETCVCTEGDCLTSNCLNFLSHCECGPNCPRGEACGNRRLTRRQWSDVKVVQMGSKGYGAVANAPIAAGALVIEYVGEVIDQRECTRRTIMDRLIGNLNFYRIEVSCGRVIDPVPYGNKARFLNHSCSPNCASEKWHVNGELRVGLFALRDIAKGEELTWNYSYECVRGAALIKCLCGSDRCSGYLGLKPKPEARGDTAGDARGAKRQKTGHTSGEAQDAAVVATPKTKGKSASKTEAKGVNESEGKRKSQSKKLDTAPASSGTPASPATSRLRTPAATGASAASAASAVSAAPVQTPLRGRTRATARAATTSSAPTPVATPGATAAQTRRSSRTTRAGEDEEAPSTPQASPGRTRKRGVRGQLNASSASKSSTVTGAGGDGAGADGQGSDDVEGGDTSNGGAGAGDDGAASIDGAMRDGAAVEVEVEVEEKECVGEVEGEVKRTTRTSTRTAARAVARVGARSRTTRASLSAAALNAPPSPSPSTPKPPPKASLTDATMSLATSPAGVVLSASTLTLRSRRAGKAGRLSGGYDAAVDDDATTADEDANGEGAGRRSAAARLNTSPSAGGSDGTGARIGGAAVWIGVGGRDEYMHDGDDTEEEKDVKHRGAKDEEGQEAKGEAKEEKGKEAVVVPLSASPDGGRKCGHAPRAAPATATDTNPDTTSATDIIVNTTGSGTSSTTSACVATNAAPETVAVAIASTTAAMATAKESVPATVLISTDATASVSAAPDT